ncbi:MAG: hypothetical protein K6E59_03985 [Bacilli bacterium]|nr:hypothetical protein [Bacilli bacterium]
MNIVLDSYRGKILLRRSATKKVPAFVADIDVGFPIESFDSQTKAVMELFKREEANELKAEPRNSLVIPNFGIGFGTFELPALSRFKMKDVFSTKFKSSFPNFESYYVSEHEYDRNSNGSVYFYSFARKEGIEQVLAAFKNNGVSIGAVDYFASAYASGMNANNPFPLATLIVGENSSELIVSKGKTVLSVMGLGYGSALLLDGENYMNSGVNPNNDKARQFAGFAMDNFAKKVVFSDENITKTDPNRGLSFAKPKETRVLKDDVLATYNIKNNFRRFHSAILDTLAYFSEAPWFLPLNEVFLVANQEVEQKLNDVAEEASGVVFVGLPVKGLEPLAEMPVSQNKLFKSGIQKERRGFDWKKFLTLEIGKKKA